MTTVTCAGGDCWPGPGLEITDAGLWLLRPRPAGGPVPGRAGLRARELAHGPATRPRTWPPWASLRGLPGRASRLGRSAHLGGKNLSGMTLPERLCRAGTGQGPHPASPPRVGPGPGAPAVSRAVGGLPEPDPQERPSAAQAESNVPAAAARERRPPRRRRAGWLRPACRADPGRAGLSAAGSLVPGSAPGPVRGAGRWPRLRWAGRAGGLDRPVAAAASRPADEARPRQRSRRGGGGGP